MKRAKNRDFRKPLATADDEVRMQRMKAYLDASKDAFKLKVENAKQLCNKANGLLAGPSAKSRT